MKTLTILLISLAAFGQDAKMAPKGEPSPSAALERSLTTEESLKFQLAQNRILRIQKDYKISEYSDKVQPFLSEQQQIFMAACKSIGIPEDKIQTECRLNTGVDEDGKPLTDPDGKPVAPRVWREVPEQKKK